MVLFRLGLRYPMPLRAHFSPRETTFLRKGMLAHSMEDKWRGLWSEKDMSLTFTRSWTGVSWFTVYFHQDLQDSSHLATPGTIGLRCNCFWVHISGPHALFPIGTTELVQTLLARTASGETLQPWWEEKKTH